MSQNLSLSVKINGRNRQDLIDALEVITKEIDDGHITGFNSNYTGDYFYKTSEAYSSEGETDLAVAA